MADIEKEKEKVAAPATVAKPVQNLDYIKPQPISSKGLESSLRSAGEALVGAKGIQNVSEAMTSAAERNKATQLAASEAAKHDIDVVKGTAEALGDRVSARYGAGSKDYGALGGALKVGTGVLEDVGRGLDAGFIQPVGRGIYDWLSKEKAQPATVAPQPAPTETGKPLTTTATFIPGGAVDQTARVPESQTAVSTEPKAPSFTGEQVEGFAQDKGQAVSRGESGNFRYVQGPNGQIVKQNTDSGEVVPMSVQGITGNILKPGEESPLAREARTRKESAATAREEAFRNALLQMAQSQGDGSFTGMGQAKRDRKMAQQLLSQLDARQQAAAQNALEREKMDITARNTEAAREQNQLAREQDLALKKEGLDLKREDTETRKKLLEGKAEKRTYLIDGKAVQMTPTEHREYALGAQKEQYLRKNKDNEDAGSQYSRYELARKQVDSALADPKNADKRDAIIAAYRKATGLDYIE